jgi:outer membrane biosynthesis protein TonB
MSNHEDLAHEETEDRFYAQFDSREVELMTLDELAAAFEAGRIHENTFVCREGESEWLTLQEVAGLGEEEPEGAPAPVVVAERRPPMPQRSPEGVETRPPMPQRSPEGVETRPPMPQRSPEVAQTRPPMPERRPEMNTVPAQRFAAVAAPITPATGLSYAPVSSNIDLSGMDLDELALRPKRRWGRVLLAAAALTVVGGGAAFALGGGAHAVASAFPSTSALEAAGNKTQASLSVDAIQTKPSEPAPAAAAPVAPAPEPAAAAAPAPDAPDAPPASAPGLSEDMKQALLAQDKVKATKHAAKVKAHVASGGGVARHAKAPSSGVFKSGGSAYDPLNGKL